LSRRARCESLDKKGRAAAVAFPEQAAPVEWVCVSSMRANFCQRSHQILPPDPIRRGHQQ
jgi:hypothetical protein